MIFQKTYQLVLNGAKTQTRRIQKPWQALRFDRSGELFVCDTRTGRPQWAVGKTYAVQPGRGKSAIGRIRITGIREQDVREISDADVCAEGFGCKVDFLNTWTQMHDKPAFGYLMADLQNRPAERYQAWVLEFQLVRP